MNENFLAQKFWSAFLKSKMDKEMERHGYSYDVHLVESDMGFEIPVYHITGRTDGTTTPRNGKNPVLI